MIALKEFAHFVTLNLGNLISIYAQLLAASGDTYASIPLESRLAAGRKSLKGVIAACEQQTSAPLLLLFQDDLHRWPVNTRLPGTPLVEIECLGQTLTPVVTNLEAGKFVWQILHELRLSYLSPHQPLAHPDQQSSTMLGEPLRPPADPLEKNDLNLKKLVARLEILAQISFAISNILNVDELLQTVVDLSKKRLGISQAYVYLLDEAGETLELAAATENAILQAGQIPPHTESSAAARAARTKKPVLISHSGSGAEQGQSFLPPDVGSQVAVPIAVGEQLLGVLDVQSGQAGYFTPADELLQAIMASQIAVALRNARLYRQAQREQAIREITEKMRTATNLQELVKTTAQELGQYFGTDISMIELGLDASPSIKNSLNLKTS